MGEQRQVVMSEVPHSNFAHIVQREVGVGLERFTAFNDKYHKTTHQKPTHTR
jgi:hypothetical protein